MTVGQALDWAKDKLLAENAFLESQVLLAHVFQQPRSYLLAWPEGEVTDQQFLTFQQLVNRREQNEPIAYLTGQQEFWSMDIQVTADTLIPRPETELLVETVLRLLPQKQARVAELGTGSGAIALALAKEQPDWQIHATDLQEQTLAVAKSNAKRLQIPNIEFFQGDWCAALPVDKYDAIVSNPPYIAESEWITYAKGLAFEPRLALVSGEDGLQAILKICTQAKAYLEPTGFLLLEHGFKQGLAVRDILVKADYIHVCTICDLAGLDRVTIGQMP